MTPFGHDGGSMIMNNPEHMPSDEAMKNDLLCPSGVSSITIPLYLWNHLFADPRGYVALFSGARGTDPRKLLARAERYLFWPDEAGSAVESALVESKNAALLRALYVGGNGTYPGEGLPRPTAIMELSPGRLQLWWRLGSEVPPETGEDLNRRLLAYDTTARGYFGNRDALTSHEVR
jgi:hypothetical protein